MSIQPPTTDALVPTGETTVTLVLDRMVGIHGEMERLRWTPNLKLVVTTGSESEGSLQKGQFQLILEQLSGIGEDRKKALNSNLSDDQVIELIGLIKSRPGFGPKDIAFLEDRLKACERGMGNYKVVDGTATTTEAGLAEALKENTPIVAWRQTLIDLKDTIQRSLEQPST